jgi:uncharacterized protein
MITDPLFYLCAIPAILLFAMAKGGLGAGLGLLSVPLMSLVVSPVQAAAIMLPLLLVMDASAVWTFRGQWNLEQVKILVPGALLGVMAGAFTFQYLSEDAVKILIAIIALSFSSNHYLKQYQLKKKQVEQKPAQSNRLKGTFWGALSGFTSFGVHAGGTPASVYLLPLKLDKKTLMATFALLFAIVNVVKLGAFAWLGQLEKGNLLTSLVLLPCAPIGVRIGYYLLHKISDKFIYSICYFFLVAIGIKLMIEGLRGLLS